MKDKNMNGLILVDDSETAHKTLNVWLGVLIKVKFMQDVVEADVASIAFVRAGYVQIELLIHSLLQQWLL